jgi:hypothetical protein
MVEVISSVAPATVVRFVAASSIPAATETELALISSAAAATFAVRSEVAFTPELDWLETVDSFVEAVAKVHELREISFNTERRPSSIA